GYLATKPQRGLTRNKNPQTGVRTSTGRIAISESIDRGSPMLPDYFIYDELKKERQKREELRERPCLEIPIYPNYRPEYEELERDEKKEAECGETILQ